MAKLIKTNGETIEVKPKNGKYFELQELQEYVGGYIEGVSLQDNSMMYVNEEGFLLNLEDNVSASYYADIHSNIQCHHIVGDAIVVPFSEESDAYDEEEDE